MRFKCGLQIRVHSEIRLVFSARNLRINLWPDESMEIIHRYEDSADTQDSHNKLYNNLCLVSGRQVPDSSVHGIQSHYPSRIEVASTRRRFESCVLLDPGRPRG